MTPRLLFLALLTLTVTACGEEGPGPDTGAVCADGSTLTYETFGKAFLDDYCVACHAPGGSQSGSPLDTLAHAKSWAGEIDRYAGSGPDATNTGMPQGGNKPSLMERQMLSEWIACGTPQ